MVRVGIIGTGIIAKEHAKAIAMVPESAKLIAASDVAQERLQEFCASFQVARQYNDAAALIADPDVDIVAITTPPVAHEALVIAALEAGKYVFCEKPLAHSLASAARIAAVEARHPGRLAVSYQLRYESNYRRLMWLCQNNAIGDLQSARIERHGSIPHSDHGKGGWWGAWGVAGGGVLMTQLIHEVDLMLLVMGRAQSVSARMDTRYTNIESEDYLEATVRFANGRVAHCSASVNSGRLSGQFRIEGKTGAVGLPWQLSLNQAEQVPQLTRALNRALPETRPPSTSIPARITRRLLRQFGINPKPELVPHARMYRDIARSIKQGRPLPVSAREAMMSLELCAAIYEAAITGKEIRLPLNSSSAVYEGVTKELYATRATPERTTMQTSSKTVRLGLIGLDTSHASAFTKILHDPFDPQHIPGAKVVAAYAGGSPDMEISRSRVGGFTSELRDKYGVPIFDTPEKVADACDLVFILSSDGRTHPSLFQTVAGRGKPVFMDKPFAISAADAQQIFAQAAATDTRVFSSSGFRYADALVKALEEIRANGEKILSCRVRYWMQIQETQGRYFWYGIHASEMLLAIMGKGVQAVETTSQGEQDTITIWHQDGRTASLVGAKNDGTFHVTIETDARKREIDLGASMGSLSARVLAAALDVLTEHQYPRLWNATGAGSVSGGRAGQTLDPDAEETLEVVRLLDAAQRSYATKQKITL